MTNKSRKKVQDDRLILDAAARGQGFNGLAGLMDAEKLGLVEERKLPEGLQAAMREERARRMTTLRCGPCAKDIIGMTEEKAWEQATDHVTKWHRLPDEWTKEIVEEVE